MNQQQFEQEVDHIVESVRALLVVKGGEYAGSDDRLANFKRGAELTGATPLQVLFVYLSKHYDAFATYVRDEASHTNRPRSEPIEGRLQDCINYCILALAMVKEARESGHIAEMKEAVGKLTPYREIHSGHGIPPVEQCLHKNRRGDHEFD